MRRSHDIEHGNRLQSIIVAFSGFLLSTWVGLDFPTILTNGTALSSRSLYVVRFLPRSSAIAGMFLKALKLWWGHEDHRWNHCGGPARGRRRAGEQGVCPSCARDLHHRDRVAVAESVA